jgi:acetolactate synthase-1/2/3 large subunit
MRRPWIPKKKAPQPDARIIHIGADPIFANYPLRGFPCDLAISGVIGATLPALTQALATREKRAHPHRCASASASRSHTRRSSRVSPSG